MFYHRKRYAPTQSYAESKIYKVILLLQNHRFRSKSEVLFARIYSIALSGCSTPEPPPPKCIKALHPSGDHRYAWVEAKKAFMANEAARKFGEGIRVNAIAPGFFLTEQNRHLLTNPDGSYTQRGQDVIRQTPFSRMGRAEELCGTVQYLISDAASFVTGSVAVVDGGFNCFAM